MSGTISLPTEARQYIDEVRAQLDDLPAEDRDELLADVEMSVVEAAAEDPSSITLRLGTPAAFASELRAAAGLPAAEMPSGAPVSPGLVDRMRRAAARFAGHPHVERARELAPVWWVARAYVAVAVLAIFGNGFAESQPLLPTPIDGPASLLLLIAAVLGSVWIGLRRSGGRRTRVANAALAVAAVWIGAYLLANGRATTMVYVSEAWHEEAPAGLVHKGHEVRNVYAFDRDGKLLLDVLLYDQLGRPLDVKARPGADPLRRPVIDRRGHEIQNAFPIRYFEPGTNRIARPRAKPDIDVPKIVTPPIGGKRRP